MIRKIVTVLWLVGVLLMVVSRTSSPCSTGSKSWREVCQLQGKSGDIHQVYDDSYLDGWRKAFGVTER